MLFIENIFKMYFVSHGCTNCDNCGRPGILQSMKLSTKIGLGGGRALHHFCGQSIHHIGHYDICIKCLQQLGFETIGDLMSREKSRSLDITMNYRRLTTSPDDCSICFERVGDYTLGCGHKFCSNCIGRWFYNCGEKGKHQTCPNCRYVEIIDSDLMLLLYVSNYVLLFPGLRFICDCCHYETRSTSWNCVRESKYTERGVFVLQILGQKMLFRIGKEKDVCADCLGRELNIWTLSELYQHIDKVQELVDFK